MLTNAPQLLAVATALPENAVTAAETRSLVQSLAGSSDPARWLAMVDASSIRMRHAVLRLDEIVRRHSIGERSRDYARAALGLATSVAAETMASANVAAESISSIVCVSCTGYMLPSLDAYLVSRLGLRPGVRRIPITELGCSAGVGGLAIARRLQQVTPRESVLLVSVEACSLCLQIEQPEPADLLGSILFGDGAAAAILGPSRDDGGPAVVADASVLWPESVDKLGMELTDSGFRFVLSPALPSIVRARVRDTVEEFLRENALGLGDVGFWIVHPGGPRILDAVANALELSEEALRPSWKVWERCGNVSSATVFFILREMSSCAPAPEGKLGVMLAFGPGVTCEMLVLRSAGWLAHGDYS